NGKLAGLITVKDIQKKEDFPNACIDENGRLRVGAAVGVGEDSLERAEALTNAHVDVVVVDTAHGHSLGVLAKVEAIKKKLGDRIDLIAGNVATADAADALIDAGVDCVKVGIGAGASCTTRVIAGVGVPQLTAVMNCVDAASKKDIPIIADGGIRYSG
ncbi:MAG TPA: IMP dehydrogenase, partial [Candidatus Marinimicrobia bacterium]|nr:IMP dehydrogenase [Candidatus Neomarinimicrobiota bacterium]